MVGSAPFEDEVLMRGVSGLGGGAVSEVDPSFLAEFVRGMQDLPGEVLWLASLVVLHRVSFLVSIGCSISGGSASALVDLIDAMQILIWMQ